MHLFAGRMIFPDQTRIDWKQYLYFIFFVPKPLLRFDFLIIPGIIGPEAVFWFLVIFILFVSLLNKPCLSA